MKTTRTMQRGYLYLALIVAIVVIIVCWPAPKAGTAAKNDSTQIGPSSAASQRQERPRWEQGSKAPVQTAHRAHPTPTKAWETERLSMYRADSTAPPRRKPEVIVELNSADTLTLQMLHGIGPAYARRIVRYRERLGGFVDYDQLLEVYGFTPELLAHIRPHLTIATDSLRTIAINSATIKQLMRHPYIDAYQARDIVAFRNKGHTFRQPDDLRLVASIDDSTFLHIVPYIDFASSREATGQ